MLKELLKKLGYEDEDITKIENGLNDSKIYLTKEENIDTRYSKLKQEKERIEQELATQKETSDNISKEYENYKKGSVSQEDYEQKVKEMQADADTKIKQSNLEHRIDLYLLNEKSRNVKSVKANIDLSKVSLDGENLIGLKEQIDSLKESDSYLFDIETKVNDGLNDTNKKKSKQDDSYNDDDDDDDLSDEEYFARLNK